MFAGDFTSRPFPAVRQALAGVDVAVVGEPRPDPPGDTGHRLRLGRVGFEANPLKKID